MSPLYLVSAFYNGNIKKIVLKFYDPETQQIVNHEDNIGHKPYCLTNLSVEELKQNHNLLRLEGFDHCEEITKTNPLTNETVSMTKIVAKDPLSIANSKGQDIRTIVPQGNTNGKIWESNIKYHQSYTYDRNLIMGLPYIITKEGLLLPYVDKLISEKIDNIVALFGELPPDEKKILKRWIQFLEIPSPSISKMAIDIEVQSSHPDLFPDANLAEFPIIAVGIQTSDNKKVILILKREGIEDGDITRLKDKYDCIFFDREDDLVLKLFNYLNSYPFVFTFNGDGFDMLYIYNRAKRLGLDNIPIIVQKEKTTLTYGLHIDLYRFFNNLSIKNYTFKQKYDNVTLNDVAGGLINKHKIEITHNFGELSYAELGEYCIRDTELTFELTDFDDEVVPKLMTVFMRISNLPMEDVTRLMVSQWIRSFIYHEHRRRNILIPWVEDIKTKGEIQTKAKIKGKKYKGAIVVESPSGVFFTVVVIDFASLYPSIIKEYNLDYMTINSCNHEECKKNIVPETTHYVCKILKGVTPLLVGTLKDARVKYYKKQSKRNDLTQAEKTWYNCVSEGVKVIMNACFTPDTYTITPEGIKNIKDFKIGDDIYTYNKKTGFIEKDEVSAITKYPHNGNMVWLNSKQMDLITTPDHNYFIEKHYSGERKEIKANQLCIGDVIPQHLGIQNYESLPEEIDVLDYISNDLKKTLKITNTKYKLNKRTSHWKPRIFKRDDFLKLLAWYISEGSLNYMSKYNTTRISISQVTYKDIVERLIKQMNLPLHYNSHQFEFCDGVWAYILENLCGKGSENKKIPHFLFKLIKPQMEVFLNELYLGDGTKRQMKYSTISNQLSEDVAHMLILLGFSPNIKKENHINRVTWRKKTGKGKKIKSCNLSTMEYEGWVYCITGKKNHFILAGRNGKFTLTGQSYGVFGSEQYDLYCPPVAEAITAIARWVISSTIEKARELGMTVIYGDTDSIFVHNPTEDQLNKLIAWTTESLKLDLEIDKTYKYVIFSSRKKNYIGCFPDGKLDIKGVTGKKKHIPTIIKRGFDRCKIELSKVNSMDDFIVAKNSIVNIIKEDYSKIKLRQWESLSDLTFHIVLGKEVDDYTSTIPQHVKAAQIISVKAGREVRKGEIIHYVKTVERVPKSKGGYEEVDSVMPLEFAKNESINIGKYMEQLESTFAPITEPLNISFDKDIKGISSLEQFGVGI